MSGRLGNSIIEASSRYYLEPKIFIGGLGGVLYDSATLSAELGITSRRTKAVTISGSSNVTCYVFSTFAMAQLQFAAGYNAAMAPLTYFYDPTGRITTINQGVFYNCWNLQRVHFPKVTNIQAPSGYWTFQNTGLKGHLIFPELTTTQNVFLNNASQVTTLYCPKYTWANLQSSSRNSMVGMSSLNRWYIPICTTFTPYYWQYLSGVKVGCKLYCDPSLETSNGGLRDPFIAYMQDTRLMVPVYVQNFDTPNPVTDLSYSNVRTTTVDLNFTSPLSGTNSVDFYEVWIDDGVNQWQQYVSHQEIVTSGDTLSNLEVGTTYTIRLKTADIYYNLSDYSNSITATTISSLGVGLISYWQFEQTPYIDSWGTNHATTSGGSLSTDEIVGVYSVYTPTDGNLIKIPSTSFVFNNGSNDLPFSISNWNKNNGVAITTYGTQFLNKLNYIPNTNYLDWSWSVNTSGKIQFRLYSTNTDWLGVQSVSVDTNGWGWEHFAMTYDGSGLESGIKIYHSGVEVNVESSSSGTYTGVRNDGPEVWLGSGIASAGNATRTRSGWHDDVKVWGRVLTDLEVLQDYNNGVSHQPLS